MEDAVWKDPNLVQAYVNDLYPKMRHGFNEVMLSSMRQTKAVFIYNYGATTCNRSHVPEDLGALNLSANGINTIKPSAPATFSLRWLAKRHSRVMAQRTRLKGEVHFMRAHFYHMLVKYWGACLW